MKNYNCVVVLGPTAVGKTSIGVNLAFEFDGEIISADSRQTYKRLDIGSGKDLKDYIIQENKIPYHLIDIIDLPNEYNVYNYQLDFYEVFKDLQSRNKMPVIVGGTGMYLDSVIRNYNLVMLPENPELHSQLEKMSLEDLCEKLLKEEPNLHQKSDLLEKNRVIKALEIIEAKKNGIDATSVNRPEIKPFIIGITLPRQELWENIYKRLCERIEQGMIEEVLSIHQSGISWERLEKLGLEYRYCSLFLQKKIETKEEMIEKLFIAIRQFAKRQETWFRFMEKNGVKINWLKQGSKEEKIQEAKNLVYQNLF